MKSGSLAPAIFVCGMISPIFFVTVFLIDGATRPDYDPYFHWISHLSLGERGWIGIANLILMGINCMTLGIIIKKSMVGKGALWGPRVIFLLGVELVLCGIFIIDPLMGYPVGAVAHLSLTGIFHFISSFVMFETLIAACFVLASQFSRWFWVYSILSGILAIMSISGCLAFAVLHFAGVLVGGPSGLFERIAMMIGCMWIVVFSGLVIREVRG
ncbi:DUF998 domain-containing protein [Bacillus sp. DNRA2]|uniref:DUF998 domain-containing protein n=1 Tax=Bacillus sp. DNRA2 TaxID=2723053 RepID=UPI00145FBD3D|nr:DUF998 domain-containing protein [Bacillus sp. DNRA2]NMD72524.1 DUF998 domain-containing protein [Bacillus sp. DNRA2]